MKCLYINSSGSGYADYVEVDPGTTVNQFFQHKMSGEKPDNFLIRVNRLPVPPDQVLQDNDRISVVANKISGA